MAQEKLDYRQDLKEGRMMLNFTSPGFDMAMELLLLLPPAPSYVPAKSLREDLMLSAQHQLNGLVKSLQGRGLDVRISNHLSDGRCLYVRKNSWIQAHQMASAYWQAMYEEKGAA
jgi:hypothetical protein